MIVACPYCNTTYQLPDEKIRPGVKLRCTVCKHVFALEEPEPESSSWGGGNLDDLDFSEKAVSAEDGFSISLGETKDKPSKLPYFLVLLAVVLVLVGGFLWQRTTVFNPLKTRMGMNVPLTGEQEEAMRMAYLLEMVGSLGIRDLRQYFLTNEKVGRIMVVEGKVLNEYDEPRELIRLEIDICDENDHVLVSKSQLAGATLDRLQLEIMSKDELERALTNIYTISTTNTNVPPGGEVPFLIIFYNPPENAVNFYVRIIEARRPPPLGA